MGDEGGRVGCSSAAPRTLESHAQEKMRTRPKYALNEPKQPPPREWAARFGHAAESKRGPRPRAARISGASDPENRRTRSYGARTYVTWQTRFSTAASAGLTHDERQIHRRRGRLGRVGRLGRRIRNPYRRDTLRLRDRSFEVAHCRYRDSKDSEHAC